MVTRASPTAGEWEWYWRESADGEADCGVVADVDSGRAVSVCRAPRYVSKEQWEADGPLLANAKHMLSVLKTIDEYGYDTPTDLEMVRDAIDKADGIAYDKKLK
jgi:hypothetical protein